MFVKYSSVEEFTFFSIKTKFYKFAGDPTLVPVKAPPPPNLGANSSSCKTLKINAMSSSREIFILANDELVIK